MADWLGIRGTLLLGAAWIVLSVLIVVCVPDVNAMANDQPFAAVVSPIRSTHLGEYPGA